MTECRICGGRATCGVVLELPNRSAEVALCSDCEERAVGGYRRLQADAAALRAQGVPAKLLSRIMLQRVERGEYSARMDMHS